MFTLSVNDTRAGLLDSTGGWNTLKSRFWLWLCEQMLERWSSSRAD